MKITKIFNFVAAHRLSYHEGLCKNLHGHTYKVEVELINIDDNNFYDFGKIKKVIIDIFDHATLINSSDLLLMDLFENILWKKVIVPYETTVENIAKHILEIISDEFNIETEKINIKLYESDTSFVEVIGVENSDN